jgi:hypothetical protein
VTFRIPFQLRDLAHVEPWGTPPNLSLSWFGLTDGAYCIETDRGRLLDFHGTPPPGLSVTWCDYQLARLFEDLVDICPTITEPVPVDVLDRFLSWQSHAAASAVPEDDALCDAWYRAQEWWGWRQLDFGYLTACPRLHLWRAGNDVHGRWRTDLANPATAQLTVHDADFSVPLQPFQDAIDDFYRGFLAQMRARVESISRDGWTGRPCQMDVAQLIAEQSDREAETKNRARLKHLTDWDAVRRDLATLGA